ncbi:hypothetical protein ACO2I3_12520 [Leptospira interrogans]
MTAASMPAPRGGVTASAVRSAVLCAGLMILPHVALAQAVDDTPPPPPVPRGPIELSIASMDLGSTKPAVAETVSAQPQPAAETRSAWRHTFGAERRAVVKTVRKPAGFSADIVVLSGVTSVAQARQVFPARNYHLVLSRQILAQTADGRPPETGVTAIAIRRSGDLRVTANDHVTELAGKPADHTTSAFAAGTAVRLIAAGRPLWVLALDLAPACADASNAGTPACTMSAQQLTVLEDWVTARQASGEAVVLAGNFHRTLEAASLPDPLNALARVPASGETPATCSTETQRIDLLHVLAAPGAQPRADLNLRGTMRASDEKNPAAGCFLMARFVI